MSTADIELLATDIMAVAKLIYRFYKQTPELAGFDEKTLWQIMFDSYGDDADGKSLISDLKDTSIWSHAVPPAKLMYEAYASGAIEESPGF